MAKPKLTPGGKGRTPRFILFDGRAKSGDTDEASVLDTAMNIYEARRAGNSTWRDYDAIWMEIDDKQVEVGLRWDLPPARVERQP